MEFFQGSYYQILPSCFHNILLNIGTSSIYCEAFYATDGGQQECVHSWAAHTGDVHTVVFSPDLSSVYSMGADGKVHCLSSL